MTAPELTRRHFLRVSATAAGGLLLTVSLPGCSGSDEARPGRPLRGMPEAGDSTPLNAFLEIDPQGVATITIPRPEMGQGVRTALAMIVAEEVGVPWDRVRVVQADLDEERYGPQYSGGSDSVERSWAPLRQAGAAARSMLEEAAARRWDVSARECEAREGRVRHEGSGRSLDFGELVADAAALTPPDEPTLRDASDFVLVGTGRSNLDTPTIVTGDMTYGLDVRVPGMLRAAIARAPVYGALVEGFRDDDARAVPGVRDVLHVDTRALPDFPPGNPGMPDGVAVLADSTWAAFKGRDALDIQWQDGAGASETTEGEFQEWSRRARGPAQAVIRDDGAVDRALERAARVVEAEYQVPFLAHAPMEPMNAVAHVRDDGCEVWTPTQHPAYAREVAALITGLDPESVEVHVIRSGGGFGRRFYADYVAEAVYLSSRTSRPVQVVWSREDDLQYSFHRPAGCHYVRGGVDQDGRLVAWRQHLVNASRSAFLDPGRPPERAGEISPYDYPAELVPNMRLEYSAAESVVPRGQWRAVEPSANVFVQQAFLDELAEAAGMDPLDFQLAVLGEDHPVPWYADLTWDSGRLRGVLERAAREAGWGEPLPEGRGRGIAASYANSSFVAHVVEVTVSDAGELTVDRVVSAVDCGVVVNRSGAEAQVEGSIVYGLSAALYGEITVEEGRIQQTNFHNYPPLRIDEMPEVEVHFIPGADVPQGLGEPPLPPLAPALANAIHDATGVRIRTLPLGDQLRG